MLELAIPLTYIERLSLRPRPAHMNIRGFIRELSGPRLSCPATDIVSKPRAWDRNVRAASLENRATTGPGGGGLQSPPDVGDVPVLMLPALTYAT